MFSALAGMYMAAKVHLNQVKINATRKNDQQVSEMVYKNKIDKQDEKDKYLKSKLPESGYMTTEEYEEKSRGLSRKEISAKILDKADMPQDANYVYVPQHKFKLVKYNDPVGSPELSLPRKLTFDRQINAQGIVSSDFKKMIYPSVYYYAETDCVSCDLFQINLDPTLSDIEKVKKANVVNKEQKPILSTEKSTDRKFIFRTLTPIDFSKDNSKLVIKEKIGYKYDGIWETDLWVYDFTIKQAKKLTVLRDAIVNYWQQYETTDLTDKRWDIYPLGFDANNDNRILVNAYAFTGSVPKFLGIWSIDTENKNAKLESLTSINVPVSVIGYRLSEEEEVLPISELEFEAKMAKNAEKIKAKQEKADKKLDNDKKRMEYLIKIHQMDMETMMKIKQRQEYLKQTKTKSKDGITNNMGTEFTQENTQNQTEYSKDKEIEELEPIIDEDL